MVYSLMVRALRWLGAGVCAQGAPDEPLEQALSELVALRSELQAELGRAAVRRHLAEKRTEQARRAAPQSAAHVHARVLEAELARARQDEQDCERCLLALTEQAGDLRCELAQRAELRELTMRLRALKNRSDHASSET
ncbi:MAG: hypothetical protein JWN48_4131 [Myxococcaceae bacterium]|nr:hypothetical protein [Myxococcaceae bacterium]